MNRQQKEERGTQCEMEDIEPKGSLKNRSHDDQALSQASTESKAGKFVFKELSLEGEISQLKQHVRERDSQLIQLLQTFQLKDQESSDLKKEIRRLQENMVSLEIDLEKEKEDRKEVLEEKLRSSEEKLEETNLRLRDAMEEQNRQNLHSADTQRRGKLDSQIRQACSMRHAVSISRDLQSIVDEFGHVMFEFDMELEDVRSYQKQAILERQKRRHAENLLSRANAQIADLRLELAHTQSVFTERLEKEISLVLHDTEIVKAEQMAYLKAVLDSSEERERRLKEEVQVDAVRAQTLEELNAKFAIMQETVQKAEESKGENEDASTAQDSTPTSHLEQKLISLREGLDKVIRGQTAGRSSSDSSEVSPLPAPQSVLRQTCDVSDWQEEGGHDTCALQESHDREVVLEGDPRKKKALMDGRSKYASPDRVPPAASHPGQHVIASSGPDLTMFKIRVQQQGESTATRSPRLTPAPQDQKTDASLLSDSWVHGYPYPSPPRESDAANLNGKAAEDSLLWSFGLESPINSAMKLSFEEEDTASKSSISPHESLVLVGDSELLSSLKKPDSPSKARRRVNFRE
ncbi:hypothetical protein GUITHDRAFT_103344 [Guillardia theta CCMP2712]|uniref:Uncharacterized protein n=1 Tax=Guillardia theta (strain CCMP2712) TaxID=905079 RepID=L1JRN7_GUITC|nr:hypothetical protein GUITHDRAFT_103344 [Guillardia theta CCMP2712]EKX50753.1 hypothetical protein GUITHDRAFT_103344 [Guillardia theta CCMP2712]|eukprot:XP_005837733.1 hypothetical protein GUITHDRAFT_103344 [Guillardia theta CCMP2712]